MKRKPSAYLPQNRRFHRAYDCPWLSLVVYGLLAMASTARASDDLISVPENLQDLSLEQLLDIKLTTGSKSEELVFDIPGTIYVITEEEIARYGWRDMREVLAAIPNLDFSWQFEWLNGGQRGFTGNFSGTLLLIDGREMTDIASQSFVTSQYSAHRIQRIEIIQGPASTLYGSNAQQGIINIITKAGNQGTDTQEIKLLRGERGTEQVDAATHKSGEDYVIGATLHYSRTNQDYPRIRKFVSDTDMYSRDPNLDQFRDLNPKNVYLAEEALAFDTYLQYKGIYTGVNYGKILMADGIEYVKYDYHGYGTNRDYRLFFVGTEQSYGDVHGTVEYQNFLEHYVFPIYNLSLPDEPPVAADADVKDVGTLSFSPVTTHRLRAEVKWEQGRWGSLIGGVDTNWYRMEVQQDNDSLYPVTHDENVYPERNRNRNEQSVFVNQNLVLLDNLRLIVGGRQQWSSYGKAILVPRASIIFRPSEDSSVKVGYGMGYRQPNVFELAGSAKKLEPLRMHMVEATYLQRLDMKRLVLFNSVSTYWMNASNLYTLEAGTGILEMVASNNPFVVIGVEDQIRFSYKGLSGFVGVRYAVPDKQEVGDQSTVLNVPKFKGNLGLSWRYKSYAEVSAFLEHWASVNTDAMSLRNIDTTEIYTIPAWTRLNLKLGVPRWRIGSVVADLALYIENLFDATYFHANPRGPIPIQYVQAPRNFRVTLGLGWE